MSYSQQSQIRCYPSTDIRVWHLENELANAAPNAIVQSSEGYVWIGTETGLLRFDGVRVVPWTRPNWEKIADHQVYVLYAGKDGTVWIGTPTNLASWSHGGLTVIDTGLPVYVNQIAEAADHSVWFTNSRRADKEALCHVVQAKAKCFELSDGLLASGAQTLIANADGSLSIGSDEWIAEWSPERGPNIQADSKRLQVKD